MSVLAAGCNAPAQRSGGSATPDTVPDFAAATFTNPPRIDNPFFPLVVGATPTYIAQTPDGIERTVVEVQDATREVMGVTCRVVRDRVYLDDVLIEDTHDFYAQDDAGNVWYLGEEVDDYNYDQDGNVVEITHEGAWEAGRDVANRGTLAQPGYQMRSSPMPGDRYSQEFYRGAAEDMAEVVALNVPVTLADGTTYSCLQTRDFTPLAPGADGYKFYAPNVGLVVEEPVNGGERAELVSSAP